MGCLIVDNQAIGGAAGPDGNGGDGLGGGLFAASGASVTLQSTLVVANEADGGAAGDTGQAGLGQGGGVYVADGATVYADALTVISGNTASTSDDDVFGVIVDI
jgi:hypothetical protein